MGAVGSYDPRYRLELEAWVVWSWLLTSGSGTACESCVDDEGESAEAIVSGTASDGGVWILVETCSVASGLPSSFTGVPIVAPQIFRKERKRLIGLTVQLLPQIPQEPTTTSSLSSTSVSSSPVAFCFRLFPKDECKGFH